MTASSKESSSLYSIISFLVVWTDYIVRIYIRIKAAVDAVVYVAQSPTPHQRQHHERKASMVTISTDSAYTGNSPSSLSAMRMCSNAPIHQLPNEILQRVISNGTKNDLLHCTMVCQRWHRLVTPLLWTDPILPSSLLPCPTDVSQSSPTYRRQRCSSSTSTTLSESRSIDHGNRSAPPLPVIIRSLRLPKYGHAVQTLRLRPISEHVTDDLLLYITRHCPNITVLDLSHCKRITSSGYQHLARSACAPSLIQLNLSHGTRLTDATLVSLSMRCDLLETIHLTGCHRITQAGVRSLVATSRQSLRYINIKDCIRVSGRILQDLAILCGPRLIGVDATRICSILHSDIKVLVQHCPRLEQLYVGQNKSKLVCQLQQRIRDEQQQQESWVMPFTSSSTNMRNRNKNNQHNPSLSPSSSSSSSSSSTSSSPRPSSTSLSASLLQQRQLSRSKSSSLYTKPNALDSLLDMLRQHNIDPVGSTTTNQADPQQQPRSHRSRHLSQPVWKYSNTNRNSSFLGQLGSAPNYLPSAQSPTITTTAQQDEADQVSQATVEMMMMNLKHLKAVDFSHWTCLTDQLIRKLRQHRGHAIQYIGLEGCSIVTQHSSSLAIPGL